MAIIYSHTNPPITGYLSYHNSPAISLNPRTPNCSLQSPLPPDSFAGRQIRRRRSSIVVSIGNLGAPLEPTSSLGRSLCYVLLNYPYSFYDAVSAELTDLADDRDDAFDRMELSFGKPDACLHRRIAELKEAEHIPIIEDIIYMIIYKKFKEINVPLIPSIDKYVTDSNFELSPSKNDELESIHTPEVMEMIKEHLISVLGWKAGINTPINWGPTMVERLHLRALYASSISYGYFLKSVSLRHRLDRYMFKSYLDIIPISSWPFVFGSGFYGIRNIALGEFSIPRSSSLSQVRRSEPPQKLVNYVLGLDQDALQACHKMRSQVSLLLVQNHCSAMFSNENSYLFDYNDAFLSSLDSLKRLVLEAIAFGCFLWDAEEYVDRDFNLRKDLKSTRMV